MIRRGFECGAFLLCLGPLSACAASAPLEQPEPAPIGACNAAAGHDFIGRPASQEAGQRLLAITGARILRWGPPDSAMTMDYREDRLNVFYDGAMMIERITCG